MLCKEKRVSICSCQGFAIQNRAGNLYTARFRISDNNRQIREIGRQLIGKAANTKEWGVHKSVVRGISAKYDQTR